MNTTTSTIIGIPPRGGVATSVRSHDIDGENATVVCHSCGVVAERETWERANYINMLHRAEHESRPATRVIWLPSPFTHHLLALGFPNIYVTVMPNGRTSVQADHDTWPLIARAAFDICNDDTAGAKLSAAARSALGKIVRDGYGVA